MDALLPGATFVEKEGIYVNTEGRPQRYAACQGVRVCLLGIDRAHTPFDEATLLIGSAMHNIAHISLSRGGGRREEEMYEEIVQPLD